MFDKMTDAEKAKFDANRELDKEGYEIKKKSADEFGSKDGDSDEVK